MSVLRQYSAGPVAWLVSIVEMTAQSDGQTLLSHRISLQPQNVLGRIIADVEVGMKARRSLTRIYQQIDGYIAGGKYGDPSADAFHRPAALSARRKTLLQQRLAQLRQLELDTSVVDTLGQFLEFAPDQRVARIRPRSFAQRFGLDETQVIATCLHAARERLLVLLWDILCPSCRIPANVQESLAALQDHGHCEACNADFDLDFANSIEMIFRAHPEIRDVEVRTYCIGGPVFSAHSGVFCACCCQVRLAPGERFELELSLAEGSYQVRGPQLPFAIGLRVATSGTAGRCEMKLSRALPSHLAPVFKTGSQFITLVNDASHELLARVERTASRHDAVTAGRMHPPCRYFESCCRERCSRLGKMVSVATVTLLMVQLDRASQLYSELGDGLAFEKLRTALVLWENSVAKQGGAVVKTIEEGVIATFGDSNSAVAAAIEIQRDLRQRQDDHSLAMRAAIHRGPAMVTTLNDRLDYFGSMVHATYRLLDSAAAGDLIVTDAVTASRDVSELLEDATDTAAVVSTDLADVPDLTNVIVQRYR